ncbi:hypothetical protein ABGB17_34245 [Sphaerisporangium sp. B11E5]|uniref:hypothetical protein n=1 Tax=Sphaerisporangium sp. B11E5 TaxID=3153563 RepID=UPI00325E062B
MRDKDEATGFTGASDFDRLGKNDDDAANPVTAEEGDRVREESDRVNDDATPADDGATPLNDRAAPADHGIAPDDKPGPVHRPQHEGDLLVAGSSPAPDPEHGPEEADTTERDRTADLVDYPEVSDQPDPADLTAPAAEIPEPVPDVVPPTPPAEPGVDFRQRWREVQASFVDDPRDAVRQADELVDEVFSHVVKRKQDLTDRWKDSDQGDTERLRVTLREYRSLLDELVDIANDPAGSESRPARHIAR